MRKQWTKKEIEYLKQGYNEEADVQILMAELDRSNSSIKHKASKLGLKIRDGRTRVRWVKNTPYLVFHINRKPVFEHRFLMEKKIGRELTDKDIVHHIDGNSLNNSLENLVLTTRAEHMSKYHLDICLANLDKINRR